MNPFIFGLSHPWVLKWLAYQWNNYHTDDVDSFIEEVLLEPGAHILPSLCFNQDERVTLIRKKYFDSIKRIVSLREIRNQLKSEFLRALTKIQTDEGEQL